MGTQSPSQATDSGYLLQANNLSDVDDPAVSLANIGGAKDDGSNLYFPAPVAGVSARTTVDVLQDHGVTLPMFYEATDPDFTNAISRAATSMAGRGAPGSMFELIWPAGVYPYSNFANMAYSNTRHRFIGDVRLRNTGTSNGMNFDAGANAGSGYVENIQFLGTPTIEGYASSGHGVYCRSIHHSKIRAKVAGCSIQEFFYALYVQFAVCTEFEIIASVNEAGGWYVDPTGTTARPYNGIGLDERGPGETVASCLISKPIIEGVQNYGIFEIHAQCNQYIGGTSEGNGKIGVFLGPGSLASNLNGMDLESNGENNEGADIFIQGQQADILAYTQTAAIFDAGSLNNTLRGGAHNQIIIRAGAVGTVLSATRYNRSNGGSAITNSGTATRKIAVFNVGTQTFDPDM